MLLIYPPISKPSEPPAGIARLGGALKANQLPSTIWDANIDGILYLIDKPLKSNEKRFQDAARQKHKNIQWLRDVKTYSSPDKYRLIVRQLNYLLEKAGEEHRVKMGMADYQHQNLSPIRKSDLFYAAEHFKANPFYAFFKERLISFLEKQPIDSIGFSLMFLSQALTTFAMAGFLRHHFPEIKILLGGGLVTSWVRNTGSKNPFEGLVDTCVAGPGEKALLSWFGKEMKGFGTISLDFSFSSHSEYLSPGNILPYNMSSGCFWRRCTFCPEAAEQNPHTLLVPDNPLEDLDSLSRQIQPKLIHFLDNAIPPILLNSFCTRPLPAPWYGYVRFSAELENEDFCHALFRSGCVLLQLGLESGSQKVLDSMNKGITLESASKILRNLKTAGIGTYVYVLFGTPAENQTEAGKTMDFIIEHSDCIQFMNAALFNMPVRSAEMGQYNARPFYEGDLSLYTDFEHPSGWDRRRVRAFLDREFKRQPIVADILRRTPPIFTSDHAPFFLDGFHHII